MAKYRLKTPCNEQECVGELRTECGDLEIWLSGQLAAFFNREGVLELIHFDTLEEAQALTRLGLKVEASGSQYRLAVI